MGKKCKKLVNPTKTVGKCTKKCTRNFIFCSLFLIFVIYYICKSRVTLLLTRHPQILKGQQEVIA